MAPWVLEDRQLQDLGQALAAELRVRRQGVPALGRKRLVGLGEARGARDHAVLEPGADPVAVAVQRRELGLCEGGRGVEDGGDGLGVQVWIPGGHQVGEAGRRKGEVEALEGRTEGHERAPGRGLRA